ncbi:TerB family tellurite resistance protein [Aliarcobacter butzleri]|uniref:TerB family tellurite resistance protein n=1 Tax=Aliarcobacter butzleri TaxID=28197 RepID=UPI002B2502D1|nr:TerB family tellurite resistance protein [Aliarcobacter butzleri]
MGIGKVLAYTAGGVVLGVGAVAAAPFTGGGSIFAAVGLGSSLMGAGTIAAAAGTAAVAGGAGAYMARKENEEDEKLNQELAEQKLRADKLEEGIKKALITFQGDREYFNYIIGLTAIGLAMANADGEIAPEERRELEEFIGGIANSNYPSYVKQAINDLYENVPNLMTAMKFISKINPKNYETIRDLIKLVMMADNIRHEREVAFIQAFETEIFRVEYIPEVLDTENIFISEIKSKI